MALDLYVSPGGNDANAGTKNAPFVTLEHARDTIRDLRAGGEVGDEPVTVWLRKGVYRRATTFELTAEDSGTEASPVVYRGFPGETVRIVGGVVVPPQALKPVTDPEILARMDEGARDHVLVLDLKSIGVDDAGPEWPLVFRGYADWPELFFGGHRMQIARWPNEGYARIAKVLDRGSRPRFGEKPDRPGKFEYSGDRPSRWLKAPEVFLKGYWCFKWYDETIKVAQINPKERSITLAAPHHYGVGGASGNLYFALNLLEELDLPGEYYIDRANLKIYFWPPEELAGQDISLSVLSAPIVSLTDASHVTLRDVTLELSRTGALSITGGESNLIGGCTIRNVAGGAVVVRDGKNHGIVGCDIYETGTSGISLNGGDRKTLTPCGHYAENNHIHHFSRLVSSYQHAIHLSGVGCRASHNLIHDAPHEAMGYSGNDHTVELNECHHVCMDADDSGAIHQGRDWSWRGNVIRYNFFHDIGGGPHVGNQGIYLDDMECGVLVYGNVLYRIYRANLVGGGRDNILQNNVIIDCKIPVHIDNRAMNWANYHVDTTMKRTLNAVPYKEEPWRTRYPKLVNIWEDDPAVPKGNVVERNLMVRCGDMVICKEAREFGTIENNLSVKDDPGFVDPEHLNFALRPDSPVFQQIPGFEPIPFDKIGLYVDEFRPALPVKTPVLSPAPGAFVGETLVTLEPAFGSADAVIRYTLDGTEPTLASALYESPIRLAETTTIKAVAYNADHPKRVRSGVIKGTYEAMRLGPEGGVYLSDLRAEDIFAHAGLKRDVNYAGDGMMKLGEQSFEKALMLCPESTDEGGFGRATFPLTGGLRQAKTLRATIGVDDAMARLKRGSVTFEVELLRDGEWVSAFKSDVMRGGDEPQEIEIDITGAEAVRLLTTDAGDNINADHAVWGGARVQ